ncbi:hypothetical protein [uncultured Ruminococcus sp.]|uniref:hypothetical protein n=1 Tax=uncultured Ruminococcus sp. TaxID=165186 RepID=UPI0025D984EE|nr:hypothetical protein [uncultured Ruminococcus sp.]
MYKLKLIKARSYNGKVTATQANPFVEVESKPDAEYLAGLGIFKIIESPAEGSGEQTLNIDKMKKDKLVAFASENGIDISDCSDNKQRVAKIKAALAESPAEGSGESDGEADFGEG